MFSWYKYLIVNLVFSRLSFWNGNLFLIAPFPDLCLLVPSYLVCLYNHIQFVTGLPLLSRLVGKPTMWFPNRSDTNRPVQAQKTARSLKFRIYAEEELYYPSSENKDADQLRGYREADLRLCFRLCRLLVFP